MDRLSNDHTAAVELKYFYDKSENAKLRRQKFQMFFAGLIFATLSFIGTHPLHTHKLYLKLFELFSLFLLLFSGVILLIRLSEIKLNHAYLEMIKCKIKKIFYGYIYEKDRTYWWSFILGMILMILNRSISLFIN